MEHFHEKSAREKIRDRPMPGETPDPTPVAIPDTHQVPESYEDMVKRFAMNAVAGLMEARPEDETPEESAAINRGLDLDIPDEDDLPEIATEHTVEMQNHHLTNREMMELALHAIEHPTGMDQDQGGKEPSSVEDNKDEKDAPLSDEEKPAES